MDETEDEKRERQALQRRFQSELFILEGDRDRLERKRADVEIEIKRIKTSIAHLEAELHDQETALTAATRQITLAEEEIKHHKKKMNAL